MKCPTNSHYEVCADNWALTCPGLTDIVFPTPECTEGCECNDGFSFNGEMCIEENKCGCFDNGKSYKVKINIWSINTKILLLGLCQFGCIRIRKINPHSDKNRPVCRPVCPHCNAAALSLQPGEVMYEENCEEKCTCQPDKGLVCEQHSCPQKTKCIVRKGVRACYHTSKEKQFSADNFF